MPTKYLNVAHIRDALVMTRSAVLDAKNLLEKYWMPKGSFTFDEVYSKEDVGDIELYLALGELVEEGKVRGPHPYDDVPQDQLTYTTSHS